MYVRHPDPSPYKPITRVHKAANAILFLEAKGEHQAICGAMENPSAIEKIPLCFS